MNDSFFIGKRIVFDHIINKIEPKNPKVESLKWRCSWNLQVSAFRRNIPKYFCASQFELFWAVPVLNQKQEQFHLSFQARQRTVGGIKCYVKPNTNLFQRVTSFSTIEPYKLQRTVYFGRRKWRWFFSRAEDENWVQNIRPDSGNETRLQLVAEKGNDQGLYDTWLPWAFISICLLLADNSFLL